MPTARLSARLSLVLALVTGVVAGCGAPPAFRAPLPLGEPSASFPVETRLLVFGDFGQDTPRQRRIAGAMVREHTRAPFALGIQLGDNLYPCGPNPLRSGAEKCVFERDGNTVTGFASDDPIFAVNEVPLSRMRAADGNPVPTYVALGNHDVGTEAGCRVPALADPEAHRRRSCLNVSRTSPVWRMPGRHYVVETGVVRVIVVDTNAIVDDYGGFGLEAEVAFVEDAARGCEDQLCFLAGHHPPAWAQGRDDRLPPPGARARMERLLAAGRGRIRAFLAGHRHNSQHLVTGGLDVLIAGGTARGGHQGRDALLGTDAVLRFMSSAQGFGVLEANASGWRFRFVGVDGRPMHCCEAERVGRCRPVRCPRE